MIHAREKGKSARRVKEIVEIESVDPKTDEVKTNMVFRWNPVTDKFEKVNDSIVVKRMIAARGGKIEDALAEIERRKKIIEWLGERGVRDYIEFRKMINLYYKEPKALLDMMEGKVPEKVEEKVPEKIKKKEKKKKRISILQLLGFRILKEKGT
jgi:flagellar protein FlaI